MKKIRLRQANGVDTSQMFAAKILGGGRGFADALAIETFSNTIAPCIKTMVGFTVIVEPYETD